MGSNSFFYSLAKWLKSLGLSLFWSVNAQWVRYSKWLSPPTMVKPWDGKALAFSQLSSAPTSVAQQSQDINLTKPQFSDLWHLCPSFSETISKTCHVTQRTSGCKILVLSSVWSWVSLCYSLSFLSYSTNPSLKVWGSWHPSVSWIAIMFYRIWYVGFTRLSS